jgi:hypothetical protein
LTCSLKLNGDKLQKQKQLVVCNQKEAYIKFKETHPDIAIRFSEFSKLRPKWNVLAGAHGTHTTCVYSSSEHETYDTGNRYVFMSGGNDKYMCVCVTLRMRSVCMVHVLHVLVQKHWKYYLRINLMTRQWSTNSG